MAQASSGKHYTKENVNNGDGFLSYKKTAVAKALFIEGPFTCTTVEGNIVLCRDGYLMVDHKGYPYPCDKEVFEESYEVA